MLVSYVCEIVVMCVLSYNMLCPKFEFLFFIENFKIIIKTLNTLINRK